ncbi:MAG TPA: signal peptide peptidase SppA [Thermoanaerobaculia bacterium]|nr:signal peptide peptidase SppA [Thermoanaerobaculia bacterium]
MKRLLLFFLVLAVLSSLLAAFIVFAARQSRSLGGPAVISWRVSGPFLDLAPPVTLPLPGARARGSFAMVYRALTRARTDPRVRGLAVSIEDASFGLAHAQELRDLMTSVRNAGKFVDCYLETAGAGSNGTLEYYLASACGHISLAPTGEMNLLGLYASTPFLRGTLDKLKIDPQFVHIGQFKSASETFTNSEMSEPARTALSAVLDDDYKILTDDIASSRKLPVARVLSIIDGAPYTASQALALKLVDSLSYPDEFRARIERLAGGSPRWIPLSAYSHTLRSPSEPRIAVVFAQGEIVRGSGGFDPWAGRVSIGSGGMAKILDSLSRDDSVRAVVLRINSPGGSALASDLILHSVAQLKKKKPVVVSMSDLAASGGYYMACGANKIVAEPLTLTGSIGVLGGKLVTRDFQKDLLGITHGSITRGANADFYSTLDRFTPEQMARFQDQMKAVYDQFIAHVAAGRAMSEDAVRAVAEGRVWTGKAALARGLVDELGGLSTAISVARKAAKIPSTSKVSLAFYPRPRNIFETLFNPSRIGLFERLLSLRADLPNRPVATLEVSPFFRDLPRPF